ncbi:glycine cleavage system aminomethyltransferase GcvT [Rhodovulum sp. DZ06]|uniref:glycine cleavage system aminomethyltransferase GcvT n=1 Tax=Rhodovulum sp. DZ06 TaxID=3425126 RepID=UPI003D32ED42
MADATPSEDLKTTPLDALHRRLGARMVGFAGWSMPVSYPAGTLAEHKACREGAALFDVSHMGQVDLRPRSGDVADAARALERLVPADILSLGEGRQRYALFTNDAGGIADDLMVSHAGDRLSLVVNAANVGGDMALLAAIEDAVEVIPLPRALLALQGPGAEAVLARLGADLSATRFMDRVEFELLGAACIATRSGYTGEDGFEISVPEDAAETIAAALIEEGEAAPAGLAARDSLRLEAGLCLHGSDIGPDTTPVEAGLMWSIQKSRRPGGARAGGFPGADAIFAALTEGPARRRVGIKPEGRAPVRAPAPLYPAEDAETPVGQVTSGGFGATVGGPVAMGYVAAAAADGTPLWAEVRGKRLPCAVHPLPFTPARFKR